MPYQLLDGKKIAASVRQEIKAEVERLGIQPHLAVILVGNDGGSESYVKGKIKACEEVGFKSTLVRYDDSVSEETLWNKIKEFNQDETLHGFIVQLPLPKHIDSKKILHLVEVKKDVDGFHPTNIGRMALGEKCFLPATPYGIMEMLERNKIETAGKRIAILGRSNIVGRPMSILLSEKRFNGTVTLLHSASKNIKAETLRADILISATGRPNTVTEEMVKPGAVVIDVGTTRVPDTSKKRGFRIVGDVDFERVAPKCSFITPVPGGVGPMTITMLMKNTLQAYHQQSQ